MLIKHFNSWSLIIVLSVGMMWSCVKDQPEKRIQPPKTAEASKRVFVINEGNFSSGNSSVSLYNTENGDVQEDYYRAVNNSALGDVAQSMTRINNLYYIVVNNSGKIVVCNDSFQLKATVTGLVSPRYLVQVAASKAYVSDYKSNCIHVLDLNHHAVTSNIALPGWTEDLLVQGDRVFVSNITNGFVYAVNSVNDQVEDSLWVGKNISGLQLDKNGKLWVLSSGDFASVPARLVRIQPGTLDTEHIMEFPVSRHPFKLMMNQHRDTLYYIDKDVYAMPVHLGSLPSQSLIQAGSGNFYGLGIHPQNSDVYVADALDYVQRSHISIYTRAGTKKAEFKAGVNANGFYFD